MRTGMSRWSTRTGIIRIFITDTGIRCGRGAWCRRLGMRLPPLLRNKFHKRAAVFTPENLLREARRQLGLFRAMLFIVSTIIMALILYTLTLDKATTLPCSS
jgi:hypothetical protein